MKKLFLTACLMATATCLLAQNGPTMGWSSWNTYGVNINESLIKRQASAMVSKGLKDVGFDHINIDDGYFGGRDKETGALLIHPTRFPNGLKTVADYIHEKGLKAGIYSDAGRNTCGSYFNNDKIAIGVGLYEHDQQDADFFFKECGFDFIKVDFCGGSYYHNEDHLVLDEKQRYNAIAQAIRNTGRTDVRMNACRWAYPGTWINDAAFSWRTTGDINDSWQSVKGILAENLYLSAYCYDGHFNDMDMLEVGRSMTTEEDKTHFGMWCIMSSPLLIGCDLSNIKSTTLSLLRNKELIALNQDPLCLQAYVVALNNGCHLLVKDVETLNGTKRAFAVYNPNDESKKVTVSFADIDLAGNVKLRDVFLKRDLGDFIESYEVSVPAHGTRIYVAEADTRLERTHYEAETAFISDYQEIKNNQSERTGIYETSELCSGGYKAGWLGYSEQNDLQWRNVYSHDGGKYQMTIAFISGENRNITISVNGKKVQTVSCNSGGWQTVGKKNVTIQLEKGQNTIRLSNPTNWMPDIDYMDLKCTTPNDIHAITIPTLDDSTPAFDLAGRPAQPNSALRIQGGRKVIMR
ncbi:MAG: alpha-galactosidase [Prevotella sp.]|nr:alpha-galactosidase [Prevotella sp.]